MKSTCLLQCPVLCYVKVSQSTTPSLTSISTNNDAKNKSVPHSTRARTPSISSSSASISNNNAPCRAVQPSDRFRFGTECKKNSTITNSSDTPDLASSALLRIGY